MIKKTRTSIPWFVLLLGLLSQTVSAQSASGTTDLNGTAPPASGTPSSSSSSASATVAGPIVSKGDPAELGPAAHIGPGDELDITVFGLPELSQHARVGSSGDVSLPLIGNLHLAGLSSNEAQALIETRLADGHFVNQPQVSVYVREYTTEGISLMGEVGRPGVYSPLGAHRLEDLIDTAGGLTEKAGQTVTVIHRGDQQHATTLTLSSDPAKKADSNIELFPGDTVVVSKAGIVYVVGEVTRPGGFQLQSSKIMASQVLAMASGPTHLASLDSTKVIRHTSEGITNVPVPLKKILAAKAPDVELRSDDILWVPNSKSKGLASSSASEVLSILGSLVIYRLP